MDLLVLVVLGKDEDDIDDDADVDGEEDDGRHRIIRNGSCCGGK